MTIKPTSIFCPFCNSRGAEYPVLSPMIVSEVPTAAVSEPVRGGAPLLSYRCQRCGYGEIHPRGAA